MSNHEPAAKTDVLQRLAAEAQIVAETTVDPNRKRVLSFIALKYRRLAEFVRLKAEVEPGNNCASVDKPAPTITYPAAHRQSS